jgi:hypothetical protein
MSWQQTGADVPQPSPFPADAQISALITNVPEDGVVLFRASAVRDTVELPTLDRGAWYDFRQTPPRASALSVY